jgi:hypothetical protein
MYFSTAAESLSGLQGEIEELSVAADGEYRSAYISLSFYHAKPYTSYVPGSPATTEVPLN